ncbi:DUF4348 domain-containing protein [Sphingobacterium ginsenosidimutans]
MRYLLNSILLVVTTVTFDNINANAAPLYKLPEQVMVTLSKNSINDEFANFIEKFSTDTAFQINSVKFPLKVTWYDQDQEKDKVTYKTRTDYKLLDLRNSTSKSQTDQMERKTTVDNNKSAKITMRGIDNGILVEYHFEKTKGKWFLILIKDNSM